jgi:hypothetical protein
MPKAYTAIRDKLVAEGMPLEEAKTHAAKIYNSQHPGSPVGRYTDRLKKKKRDHLRELGESAMKKG